MKVILLDNIKGVGKKDEIINASDGYARNYLLPKKLAVEANAENIIDTLKEIKNNKFKVMVTALDTKKSIYNVDYNKKAIVIGNEANGVSKEVQALADEKVKIPMLGKTESLNASVATGIIVYEYVRRKL